MKRSHIIVILNALLLSSSLLTRKIMIPPILFLIQKIQLFLAGKNKSLINPRNLELKKLNYWEEYANKLKKSEPEYEEESLYKPMISFGIGTLSFFGDIGDTILVKIILKDLRFKVVFLTQ